MQCFLKSFLRAQKYWEEDYLKCFVCSLIYGDVQCHETTEVNVKFKTLMYSKCLPYKVSWIKRKSKCNVKPKKLCRTYVLILFFQRNLSGNNLFDDLFLYRKLLNNSLLRCQHFILIYLFVHLFIYLFI